MNIKINLSYAYGAYSIRFSKVIRFPSVPNMGISIIDYNDEVEFSFELRNHDYQNVNIYYDIVTESHYIDIRFKYPDNVCGDAIDQNINTLESLGWDMTNDESESIKRISEKISKN